MRRLFTGIKGQKGLLPKLLCHRPDAGYRPVLFSCLLAKEKNRITPYCPVGCNLLEATLGLVEDTRAFNSEARIAICGLQSVPYLRRGRVKNKCSLATWLEDPTIFAKGPIEKALISPR